MRAHGFDIFSGFPSADPLWLEAVDGLGQAILRMKEISRKLPGRYFVYSVEQESVLTSIDTSSRANGGPEPVHDTRPR
jgi:hypothetical protein